MSVPAEKVEARTLPEPVARRNISEETWLTLNNSVFPGALAQSILAACDYCAARGLDVLKKPVHIVPMQVEEKHRNEQGGIDKRKVWRDVIMPGIAEHRTTAFRTGCYLGKSAPVFGNDITHLGVTAPEWCDITVKRLVAGHVAEFTHREYFVEAVATTKWDGQLRVNSMWTKRPRGQLVKCAEAGALREAFPEELGGELAAEEMEGRVIDADAVTVTPEDDAPAADTQEAADNKPATATDNLADRIRANQTSVEPASEASGLTANEVMAALKKAQDQDELDQAADLIREVPDDERPAVQALYDELAEGFKAD